MVSVLFLFGTVLPRLKTHAVLLGSKTVVHYATDEPVVGHFLHSQAGRLARDGLLQEVLDVVAQVVADREGLQVVVEEVVGAHDLPGFFAVEHDVEDHSQRPDIAFLIEDSFLNAFWTLVAIEGNFSFDFRLVEFPAVPESGDLEDVVFEEKRGGFEPPMDEFLLHYVGVPCHQVPKKRESLRLPEGSPGRNAVTDVSALAELSDDVAIVDSRVDIQAAYDVGVAQLFQGIDFYAELFFESGVDILIPEVYHFDGYCFERAFIDSFENVAPFGEVQVVVEPV